MFDVLERKKSVSTRTKEVVPDQPEEEEYHFDSLVNDKDFKVCLWYYLILKLIKIQIIDILIDIEIN